LSFSPFHFDHCVVYSSSIYEGYYRHIPDVGYYRNIPDEGYYRNIPDAGYYRNLKLFSSSRYTKEGKFENCSILNYRGNENLGI
jgi:hypothetical protein